MNTRSMKLKAKDNLMEAPLYLIAVPLLLIILYFLMRNALIGARNAADQAFATIDVMLKQRCDLIPNLVAAAKTYMKHEASVLTDLTALRAKATSPTATADEKIQANNAINHAMRALMVNVENYPQLKADSQFTMLQRSLNETEAQIAAARRAFNAAITDYNNSVEKFPMSIVASMSGFTRRSLFEIPEAERAAPNVNALFNA